MQKLIETTMKDGVVYPIPASQVSVLLGLCAFVGCLFSICAIKAMTRRNVMLVGHLL
jgi:hypothetical protein